VGNFNFGSFSWRIAVAFLTFITGISVVVFWYFRPLSVVEPGEIRSNQSLPISADDEYWQTLISVENQNLSNLDENSTEKVRRAIMKLTTSTVEHCYVPRLFTKISNYERQQYYILIEESPLVTIPGGSQLCVHLFSLDGKLLNMQAFEAGWRIGLEEVMMANLLEIDRPVLQVNCKPYINGANVAKQYYALIGKKLRLIRLERDTQELAANYYYASNKIIGPAIHAESVGEVKDSLKSTDNAEVLAYLTWLSAIHLSSANFENDPISQPNLVNQVKRNIYLKELLFNLEQSENVWIQQAAKLAITNPEYYGLQ
jgi:hypothetical protein